MKGDTFNSYEFNLLKIAIVSLHDAIQKDIKTLKTC